MINKSLYERLTDAINSKDISNPNELREIERIFNEVDIALQERDEKIRKLELENDELRRK